MVVKSAFWPTMRYALTSMPAAHRINVSLVFMRGASQKSNRESQEDEPERDGDELGDAEQPKLRVRALDDGHGDSQQEHLAGPCQQRHRDRPRLWARRDARRH